MTKKPVRYLTEEFPKAEFRWSPVALKPNQTRPGQAADGYGRKISSDYTVKLKPEDKKRHRVYICQISNAATAYVLADNGDWLCVKDGDLNGVKKE